MNDDDVKTYLKSIEKRNWFAAGTAFGAILFAVVGKLFGLCGC